MKLISRRRAPPGLLLICFALLACIRTGWAAETHMHLIERSSDMRIGTAHVAQGTSETMKVDMPFTDIVVGDPDIADVVPLTDKSLYVLGKKLGRTSVSIYDKDKQLLGVLDVEVSYDTGALSEELRRRVPQAHIEVSSVNGRILLSGTVPDSVTLDRAISIAKQFGTEVVPSLSVGHSQQVMLEVRFLEASRNAGRELGAEINHVHIGSVGFDSGQPLFPTGNSPFGSLVVNFLTNGVSADVIIHALEQKGLARRLAEPNLVALSGDTASFLAGGEFPFPVQSGTLGQVSIEFKKFGVGLAFTPTVLNDGLINLKIEPEVSELDPTQSVTVGGVQVPSLIVRRASTTVELKDGQSFAMAGLLQSVNTDSANQLPWLGEIPVLGALFRSASFQRHETDLVIIITPHLVRPTAPGQHLRTPLEVSRRANDAEYFFGGMTEVPNHGDPLQTGAVPNAPSADNGHILSLPNRGGAHVQTP